MTRRIVSLLMLCLYCVCAGAETAPKSELEKLFDAGQYEQFRRLADPLADKEQADALFLLGKAFHLGKGVEKSTDTAFDYYERAAKKNHVRAIHNLGVLFLDEEHTPSLAIPYFERALQLGLKSPTLFNLGRALKGGCDLGESTACRAAGDTFIQVWELDRKNTLALDEAVVSYSTGCVIDRSQLDDKGAATPECKHATEWADKGVALGLARSTYNRGALEYYAKRYAAALPLFKLAHERGEGLAAYLLGKMYEDGEGVKKSQAEMLTWFKRGALLKNTQAVNRMIKYWNHEVDVAEDPATVKAAMSELLKIEKEGYVSYVALKRLRIMELLASNAKVMPKLATEAIDPHFCPMSKRDMNTDWWIRATSLPSVGFDESNRLASGKLDAKGCVTLSPVGLDAVRKALALGKTPVLRWPASGRLLSLARGPNGKLGFQIGNDEYIE